MQRTSRRRGFTLVELLTVVAVLAMLIALLLPAVQQAREALRQTQCRNNIRQISLALHNYRESHGIFPIGVLGTSGTASDNHLLTTWQTLLLPFVEQSALYDDYDFNVRFDHSNNAAVVRNKLPVYLCPSNPHDELVGGRFGPTHYAANAGTEPGADDGLLFPLSSTGFRDLPDGTSSTLSAGEIAHELGGWARGSFDSGSGGGGGGGGGGTGGGGSQGWARGVLRWWKAAPNCAQPGMNPPETNCANSSERRFQFSSAHPGGAHFSLAGGSARFVSENIDVDLYRALITRSGGEIVGRF